jgi:hypothetical protein
LALSIVAPGLHNAVEDGLAQRAVRRLGLVRLLRIEAADLAEQEICGVGFGRHEVL